MNEQEQKLFDKILEISEDHDEPPMAVYWEMDSDPDYHDFVSDWNVWESIEEYVVEAEQEQTDAGKWNEHFSDERPDYNDAHGDLFRAMMFSEMRGP